MSTGSKLPPEEAKEEELSIPEIISKHKGKWVAMIVTNRDDNLQPIGGKVVAEDIDRYRLREHLSGHTDICIFYAGVLPYPLLL